MMNKFDSMENAIRYGFYRYLTNGGGLKITNGKEIFNLKDYALINQHFEFDGSKRVIHLLNDIPDGQQWPLIKLTVDFTKPYGKIPGQPLLNIAPASEFTSENNSEDTSVIWRHIENLCGRVDGNTKEWVKDWLADIFQNPMKKPGTALTFRSEEGTGKGLIFDNLMHKLLGERHLSTSRAIYGERFNGEAKHRLLINFDEGSCETNTKGIGALKKFITDSTFSFEGKGKDTVLLPNMARTVFTSNAGLIMKNDGSRRFCMLNPVKADYCNAEYFNNLVLAIENESIVRKFLYELENRAITHNLRIIPKTEEYYNQEVISYDYIDTWLNEVLKNESAMVGKFRLWKKHDDDIILCLGDMAVNSYMKMTGNRITSQKLFRRLRDKVGKFGYAINSVVSKDNGSCCRLWEFSKIA